LGVGLPIADREREAQRYESEDADEFEGGPSADRWKSTNKVSDRATAVALQTTTDGIASFLT
jgi:hypothetical protein